VKALAALAERVRQILAGAGAITVERQAEAGDANLGHESPLKFRLRTAIGCALARPILYCKQFPVGSATFKAKRVTEQRSGCPIKLTLETLGDRWSLIVIRDMMFGNRRHFRVLLNESEEGIASNILADRLKRLNAAGLVTKADDPSHKQKGIYSLTEKAIQLVPLLAYMGAWGRRHLPATPELAIRARLLEEGGEALWNEFMDELRAGHLGAPARAGGPSVGARLRAAYEAALAEGG
jgi:DNA-binding HxlR family transcriptional regulator